MEQRVGRAVADLVAEVGFDRWSIDDVAARSRVSRSTIFRRWGSKPQVLTWAFERIVMGTVAPPDTGSVRDDLIAMVDEQLALFGTKQGRSTVTFALAAFDAENPELSTAIRKVIWDRRAVYEAVIVRAQARGEIDEAVQPDVAVALVFGAMWGHLLGLRIRDRNRVAEELVDTALRGLSPR